MENVTNYAHSESFAAIVACLRQMGYIVDWSNVNSQDHGVPQSRLRLILRAMQGGLLPPYPPKLPRRGWLSAIEDLLPTLPETRWAPWQQKRLAAMPQYSFLLMTGNTQIEMPTSTGILAGVPPANTVTAQSQSARAFLYNPSTQDTEYRCPEDPAPTVLTSTGEKVRAYVVSGTDATVFDGSEPFATVTASLHSKTAMPRAYLVDGQTGNNGATMQVIEEGDPMLTVAATQQKRPIRALLLESQNAGRPLYPLEPSEQARTVTNSSSFPRAAVNGKVVRLSLQCLARFQSFDDSYIWPKKKEDMARLIGNAAPFLLCRRLLEPFVALLEEDPHG